MEQGSHFRTILKALASLDYFIEWRLVNPINFGIPQNRDRVFIFGTLVKNRPSAIDLEKFSIFFTSPDSEHLKITDSSINHYLRPISEFTIKNHNWGIAYQNRMYMQSLPALPDIKPQKKTERYSTG